MLDSVEDNALSVSDSNTIALISLGEKPHQPLRLDAEFSQCIIPDD